MPKVNLPVRKGSSCIMFITI